MTSPLHPDVVAAHRNSPRSQARSGKMLILIPYREFLHVAKRERAEHMLQLTKALDTHLRAAGKVPGRDYATLVVEMGNNDLLFNKGYLLNIGVRVAAEWAYDYIVFHDVDYINERGNYVSNPPLTSNEKNRVATFHASERLQFVRHNITVTKPWFTVPPPPLQLQSNNGVTSN